MRLGLSDEVQWVSVNLNGLQYIACLLVQQATINGKCDRTAAYEDREEKALRLRHEFDSDDFAAPGRLKLPK